MFKPQVQPLWIFSANTWLKKALNGKALRLLLRRVRQMERTPHEDDEDEDAPAASRTAPSLLQRRGTFETITNVFAGAEQTLGRAFLPKRLACDFGKNAGHTNFLD